MKLVLFFIVSIAVAASVNFIASLLLRLLAKRNSVLRERVRVSSIDEAFTLGRKSELTEEEKLRLWSDAMNILMTTESEEEATRYVEKTALVLGNKGPEFRKIAAKILTKRFDSGTQLLLEKSV